MDDTYYWPNFRKMDLPAGRMRRVVTWHVAPGQHVQEGDVLCDVEIDGSIMPLHLDDYEDGIGCIVGPIRAEVGAPLSPGDVIASLWGITLEPEATEEELAFDEQHGPTAGMA